jgi:hypothetical protein
VQLGLALQLVGVQVHDVHHGLPGQQEPGGALVLQVEGAVLVRRVLRASLFGSCGVKWYAVTVSQTERHATKQATTAAAHNRELGRPNIRTGRVRLVQPVCYRYAEPMFEHKKTPPHP